MPNDLYAELKEATPEQLLKAATRFYAGDNANIAWFLYLGFALARPGGWEYIAPAWLRDIVTEDEDD